MSKLLLIGLSCLFWASCTSKPEAKLDWTSQGILPPSPDSVKIQTQISFQLDSLHQNQSGSVDAYIFALPLKKYRIEIKGPLGIHLASVLWDQGNWQVYVPDQEIVYQGTGQSIQLPVDGLNQLDIHQFVNSTWGQVFPEGWTDALSTQNEKITFLQWNCPPNNCISTIENTTGRVESLQKDSTLWKYSQWTKQGSYKYPALIEIFEGGQKLKIEINEIDFQPKWNSRLWKLRFPPSTKVRAIPL